jgi:hypothetical protein
MRWANGALAEATLRTTRAGPVRVRAATTLRIERDGKPVELRQLESGVITFESTAGATYRLTR